MNDLESQSMKDLLSVFPETVEPIYPTDLKKVDGGEFQIERRYDGNLKISRVFRPVEENRNIRDHKYQIYSDIPFYIILPIIVLILLLIKILL